MQAAAADAAGRIVLAASVGDYDSDNATYRLQFVSAAVRGDGTADTSFGGAGVVTTPFLAATSAYDTAAARQADGKVVTATVIQSNRAGVALTRFNADGTIDATFGDGGTALLDVDTYWGSPIDLAIDSRGRIVVSVQGRISGGSPHLRMLRAASNGRADTTFGDGGVVRLDAIDPTFISETSLAFQGQKILLGFGREGSGLTVARFDDAGRLDTTFGAAGLATTPRRSASPTARPTPASPASASPPTARSSSSASPARTQCTRPIPRRSPPRPACWSSRASPPMANPTRPSAAATASSFLTWGPGRTAFPSRPTSCYSPTGASLSSATTRPMSGCRRPKAWPRPTSSS